MASKELTTSKRDFLINQYLLAHGIASVQDAPDELLEAAHADADKVLGDGEDG